MLRASSDPPTFREQSLGGAFKGRDPSVPSERLTEKWVDEVETVYLGRATSLRARLNLYARFGRGTPVARWGGRLIWQLQDADDLLVAWLPDPEPAKRESELVARFIESWGSLPFANLNQPRAT